MNNQIAISTQNVNVRERKQLSAQDINLHKSSQLSTQAFFFVKHAFDLTLAILSLPLLAVVAVVVKLLYLCTGDFAPIFYAHRRLTKNGEEFMCHKFRTMVRNSDEVLTQLLRDSTFREKWNDNHKLANDPRITKVGKLLRRTSIDELPQIINIIRGEMSFVGPRPVTTPEAAAYGEQRDLFLSLRPGLTGWWACNGRSCTTNAKRRELELYYCEHASLRLDLKCFARTVIKVITQEGAR